jgi:hypothetical protein
MAAAPFRLELGREYPPPSESADIAEVVALMVGEFSHNYPPGCPSPVRRDQHPKAHGCVRAVFTVADDLPKELCHGLFRTPRSYDAWIRFSSSSPLMTPDTKKDAHGMAIKLLGVPGLKVLDDERDAQTQDFVLANNAAFFVRSAKDYVLFAQAIFCDRLPSFFFGLNPLRCRLRELSNMLSAVGKRVTNPLQIRYWSQTPYKLGPHAVKYSVRPRSTVQDSMPETPGPDFLRQAMAAMLRRDEVVFEFLVQIQTDPIRMPVEDSTVVWSESVSSFRRVATLTIPVQECDTPERHAFAEQLSFNPWHSLPEHRPVGSMNRIRRQVYETISEIRHTRNGVPREEPGEEARDAR